MELIEAMKQPFAPPRLLKQTIPIGVGLAIPFAWREPLLRVMPAGFQATLGRFGIAASEALMGAGVALATNYAVPDEYKEQGYLTAATMVALAGYDAIKALIGGSLGSHSSPGNPVSPVVRGIQPYQGKVTEFR